MTATVTALIELAVDHGLGVAFLVVGGQILLDRLAPVEFIVSRFSGAKKSAHPGGAHRRVREPRPSRASNFASSLHRHRNEPIGCMK